MADNTKELSLILGKASVDAEFRARLLETPADALRSLGFEVTDPDAVRFIERPAGIGTVIVLPDFRPVEELSADELESVAGGMVGGEESLDCTILSNCKCSISLICPTTA